MAFDQTTPSGGRRIAVIGAGISGLSAAWLLSQAHEVDLYEAEDRLGGHAQTVDAGEGDASRPVDIGFIVYNEANYPNFTALMRSLEVETQPAHMCFGVSRAGGRFEYATSGLSALFAQKRNLASPRFWRMIADIRRFHATAPGRLAGLEGSLQTLGGYLEDEGYSEAFRRDHLLPQAAAIWSSSPGDIALHPAAAFIRFYKNHRLLEVATEPNWRTVRGGSRAYVSALTHAFRGRVIADSAATRIVRDGAGVEVHAASGRRSYDEVVIATHSDQALRLIEAPTAEERGLLGAIRYRPNRVVLHTDVRLMPRRRAAWAAWNHMEDADGRAGVTYWMNRLQGLPGPPLLVTLNPPFEPSPGTVLVDREFDHPVFDAAALTAQASLWSLQGVRRTWFCGAWFGAGFHEDGLQAGLAVAEQLGGVRRPWSVENESGRIPLRAPVPEAAE